MMFPTNFLAVLELDTNLKQLQSQETFTSKSTYSFGHKLSKRLINSVLDQ